jgi:hypothetical protein
MQPTIHWNVLVGHGGDTYPALSPDVLWVAFSIPPGSHILFSSRQVLRDVLSRYRFGIKL